ncbi:MAG: diguanylate cyclase [Nitrospirae bacterium]|nr:diguanylate cyclase [Nitrospirota bacterium]
MKISRKFDIYTAFITVLFIIAILVSYRAIRAISDETSNLFDVSNEFDYLTRVRQKLTDLQHNTEHYLHVRQGDDYSNAIMRDLTAYEQALGLASAMKLDEEELKLIRFANDGLPEFSALLMRLIKKKDGISAEDKQAYGGLRVDYIEKILQETDTHWKEDLKKVTGMSGRAKAARTRAMGLLAVLSMIMIICVLAARIFFTRIVLAPIREIEKISNDIARGDISKRGPVTSDDEFGGLSKSINLMADAIKEKIDKLEQVVNSEQAVVREQKLLNELMGIIASGVDINEVLRVFLARTRDLLQAEHSSIFIMELRDNLEPEMKIFANTFEETSTLDCARTMVKGVFFNVIKTLTPLRINTPLGETPVSHLEMRNLLAVPLVSHDKNILGLIVIVNKEGGFSKDDEDVLFTFSFQAFQAVTLQQEIMHYATTDGLTGLNNHRIFRKKLQEEIRRAERYGRSVSLLMIDIDHFKAFNDAHGHQEGDHALKTVAGIINKNIRSTDFGARYGGEEFAVILPEATGPQAHIIAERMRMSISSSGMNLAEGRQKTVTISIGHATFPDDAVSDETLIRNADLGLYSSKERGRNRVTAYSETASAPLRPGDGEPPA